MAGYKTTFFPLNTILSANNMENIQNIQYTSNRGVLQRCYFISITTLNTTSLSGGKLIPQADYEGKDERFWNRGSSNPRYTLKLVISPWQKYTYIRLCWSVVQEIVNLPVSRCEKCCCRHTTVSNTWLPGKNCTISLCVPISICIKENGVTKFVKLQMHRRFLKDSSLRPQLNTLMIHTRPFDKVNKWLTSTSSALLWAYCNFQRSNTDCTLSHSLSFSLNITINIEPRTCSQGFILLSDFDKVTSLLQPLDDRTF